MDHDTAEVERPAKRRREDHKTTYRGRGESYRPQRRGNVGHTGRDTPDYGRGNSYRPVPRRQRRRPDAQIDEITQRHLANVEHDREAPPMKSSAKVRKVHTSPSDRIHSLKKLLQNGSVQLPANIRQEKERELAALLFDQQKEKVAKQEKKNLKRYHMVRFMERQKATRVLKQLKKQKDQLVEGTMDVPQDLEDRIRCTEVDVNYTIYAPLGQKYISLFVSDEKTGKKNQSGMKRQDIAMLTEEQKAALQEVTNDSSNVVGNAAGSKPPMWYEVEKCMREGQSKLDALRDGKLNQPQIAAVTVVGDREAAKDRKEAGQSLKRNASWLDDDGIIDAADLDSDQDQEMSDGEFFER